jgi:hypothetical protein
MSDQTALVLLILLAVIAIFMGLLITVVPDVRDVPTRRRNALFAFLLCVAAGTVVMLANVGLSAILP